MRKFILTGHSRGLGAAIAHELIGRGHQVLGISRSGLGSGTTGTGGSSRIGGASRLREASVDLSEPVALAEWLDSTPNPLDEFLRDADDAVLINNAGMVAPVGPAGRQDAATIARAVNLNVSAALMLSDRFIAATSRATRRAIVHISSGAGRNAMAGWSVYCATKAALDMHASATALDTIDQLKIVSLAPGVIDTDMQASIRSSKLEDFPMLERFEQMKRDGALSSPEDAARRITDWLMSPSFGDRVIADLRQL